MKRNAFRAVLLIVGFSSFSALASHHKILNGFEQLLAALQSGDEIHAVINFDNCVTKPSSTINSTHKIVMTTSGGFSFNIFNHYKLPTAHQGTKEVIGTARTVFAEVPGFGAVNNYVNLSIYDDNTASVHAALYDPKTYAELFSLDSTCPVSDDSHHSGVMLYNVS